MRQLELSFVPLPELPGRLEHDSVQSELCGLRRLKLRCLADYDQQAGSCRMRLYGLRRKIEVCGLSESEAVRQRQIRLTDEYMRVERCLQSLLLEREARLRQAWLEQRCQDFERRSA